MTLHDLMTATRSEVLDDACASLECSYAVHYVKSGEAVTRDRLSDLFDLVHTALLERRLEPVGAYCEQLAEQRFRSGFELAEVQAAFNALEVAMWRKAVDGTPADELVEAVALLSTVFGFGKDALARRYVSLASHRQVPTLDVSALFAGIGG